MKKRRHIVLEKQTVLFLLIGAFFLYGAYVMYAENDVDGTVLMVIIGALFVIVPSIFMPCCYIFDSSSVSAHYLFLPDECWLWENVRKIKQTCDHAFHSDALFGIFFSVVYEIDGKSEGKRYRYMNGYVRKSRRVKKLIGKYWDGEITGGFWYNRRKKREEKEKEKLNFSYGTEEANAAERELRKSAKEWLTPFEASANESGFTLKHRFVFVSDDLKTLNSRPRSSYTYTLFTDISRSGESFDNKTMSIDFELAFVRLGKTAYRVFQNKGVKEEIADTLTEILDDIKTNGIEEYLNIEEI